ncbi:MAG TPA: tRNA pseudouridine(55) synthase TruB [Bacillota bacterium]|nr:tRNA pseudouridine(55) synthase TruB [Bacillota bacterium]
MDGLIAIDKPPGMTSHDVVARVRRIAGQRSAGHTGTLDPDATGLLVVCMGRATRLTRFMEGFPKEYEAEIVFGVSTDTGDDSGRITARSESFSIPLSEFLDTLGRFLGDIRQTPPMISAVHHEGERLYELARRGITVERQPRTVTIFEIEPLSVVSWPSRLEHGARGKLRIRCSRGTYIRTLCEDICRSLGIAGHMGALTRTATSGFTLDQAVTLEELEHLASLGSLAEVIKPPIEGVRHLPSLDLAEREADAVSHGMAFECDGNRIMNAPEDLVHVALVRPDGNLAAVAAASRSELGLFIQPRVVL